MHTKENRWTKEEEELLTLGLYPTELSKHPIMIAGGRTRGAIHRKIHREREKAARPPKQPKPPKEKIKPKTSMRNKEDKWTAEEIAILKNGQMPRHQAPLLPGRSIPAIQQKRKELGLTRSRYNPADRVEQPGPADAYDGRLVRPYQFISTREATPARKKVWAKEERALQTI